MNTISQNHFQEVYQSVDRLFRGDTHRAQLLAANLDNGLFRSASGQQFSSQWLYTMKIVLYAYILYSWDCDLAWQAAQRNFGLVA